MMAFIKFAPTDDDTKTIIYARNLQGEPVKMEVAFSYERCQKALWDYNQGAFIQDAFPFLDADERNFMQTGMTPEEWDAMCGEDDA